MPVRIIHVDAFTNKPFQGNPAGVCFLTGPREDLWMSGVAKELNLSATAFLYAQGGGYHLRWFTASSELRLCGHATLAASHALWEEGDLPHGSPAIFHTQGGILSSHRRGDWIEMDFPAKIAQPVEEPAQLSQALGAEFAYVGRNDLDYLVEVADELTLRSLHPRFDLLRQLPVRAVIATARGTGEYDFVSRFFAPAVGLNEDSVTGSAHTALGPYWADRLGKKEMNAFQASARGGILKVRPEGDRVFLSGQAVTVLRGELLV